jgi:hypothetical protein
VGDEVEDVEAALEGGLEGGEGAGAGEGGVLDEAGGREGHGVGDAVDLVGALDRGEAVDVEVGGGRDGAEDPHGALAEGGRQGERPRDQAREGGVAIGGRLAVGGGGRGVAQGLPREGVQLGRVIVDAQADPAARGERGGEVPGHAHALVGAEGGEQARAGLVRAGLGDAGHDLATEGAGRELALAEAQLDLVAEVGAAGDANVQRVEPFRLHHHPPRLGAECRRTDAATSPGEGAQAGQRRVRSSSRSAPAMSSRWPWKRAIRK